MKEGPSEEELEQARLAEERQRAWEEMQAITQTKQEDRSLRIESLLSW